VGNKIKEFTGMKASKNPTQRKIKKLKHQADLLFYKLTCIRHPQCLVCETNKSQTAHHFIYKSQSKTLRYDFRNAIPICNICHCKHHQAGDPRIVDTIIRKNGVEWANELYKIKETINKEYRGVSYYESKVNELENLIKKEEKTLWS